MRAPGIALLDRDGTIIRDVQYISDPESVGLIESAVCGRHAWRHR